MKSLPDTNKGFTMIEAAITVALFSIVMYTVMSSVISSQKAINEATSRNYAELQANNLAEKICKELIRSGASNILLYDSNDPAGTADPRVSVRYQKQQGVQTDGTTQWTATFFQIKRFDANDSQYPNKVILWEDVSPTSNVRPGTTDSVSILSPNCSRLEFQVVSATANPMLLEMTIEMERTTNQWDNATKNKKRVATKPLVTRVAIPKF